MSAVTGRQAPCAATRSDPSNDEVRAEAGTRPTILQSVADVLLGEIDAIMRAYVARVRSDDDTPSAYTNEDHELEDHLATFLADIASTLASVDVDAESPPQSVRDGTAIQRIVAQRHGAQRARLGWKERELRRDFVILEEEIRAAISRALPAAGVTPTRESAAGEAGRAMILVHQALRIAEELSLEGFRRARAAPGERALSSEDQSL